MTETEPEELVSRFVEFERPFDGFFVFVVLSSQDSG